MPDGLSTANANLAAAAAVGSNAGWVGLFIGDPGSAGTANEASVTTRDSVTWGAASGGAESLTTQPAWGSWAGTNGQVISDLGFFSASTGGTFGLSMPISPTVTMNTGDNLTITSATVTIPTAS